MKKNLLNGILVLKRVSKVSLIILFFVFSFGSKAQNKISISTTIIQLEQNIFIGDGVAISNIPYAGFVASFTSGNATNPGINNYNIFYNEYFD